MSMFQNGTTPASAPVSDSAISPFANGTAAASNSTSVHGYPLPPEGRQYRPAYSGGRYVLPSPAGGGIQERYTRVTTGAKALEDTSGLEKWKLRNVVLGLKDAPELLESIDLFAEPREVTLQLNRVADQAQEKAGAKQASELGTAIHAWTEAVERDGMDVAEVPEQFQPYVRAYLARLAEWGISTVPGMVERIVYHSGTGWVGTLDRIYQLADGTHVIGDVKTSKDLRYSMLGFATQLSVYADADYMLRLDGTGWDPMPPVGNMFGVIAHVPSNRPGQCELVTIDLEGGRVSVELAEAVRQARAAATRAGEIRDRWELPRPATSLEDQVRAARSAEDLAQLWVENQHQWSDELTQLGYAVIAEQAR